MPVEIPYRSPWTNQRLVLWALLHREAVRRFGQYKMGVLWMLTEPLIGVIILGVLLGPLVGRTAPNMPYAFFLLNGFVLLQTFTGPMIAGLRTINSNRGLLVFPKVQPLDLMLARFIFELSMSLMAFSAFCLVGSLLFGVQLSLDHLHVSLAAFLITWMLGCGFGLLLTVAAAYLESADKIVAFIRRPLLFISCVLYPMYGLPNSVQKILLYNPLAHTIEISRKSLFPLYHTGSINLAYPFCLSIVVLSIGICVFHNNRHYLTEK